VIGAVLAGLVVWSSCGGGSGSGGGGGGTTTVSNTVSVGVNSGPAGTAVNSAYVSVEVCNPGSTSACVTIPYIQVDTGSAGLRLLSTAPGVSSLGLTAVTNSSSTPVDECYQFGDGSYLWGPVMQADVIMGGEKAASLPVQIANPSGSGVSVPSTCSSQGSGVNLGTVSELKAYGILGIGNGTQDCGSSCTATSTSVPSIYWLCPTTGCTGVATVPIATQVSNPVTFFSTDNNGIMLTLPALGTAGLPSTTGTLNFGIGTQTDNALGSANVYALAYWGTGTYAAAMTMSTKYNSVAYPSFLDTAAPATLFLDAATTGISTCFGTDQIFYCPSSNQSVSVQNTGYPATTWIAAQVSIGNAQTLLGTSGYTAFSNLVAVSGGSGASTDAVEYGLPFFFGKTVFVGIAGKTAPSGVSTTAAANGYWAF
jgi:hypothetical protein